MKYQIFEALDAQQLTEMMQQVYDPKQKGDYSNVIEKCDIQAQVYYVETEVSSDGLTPSNFFDTDEKKEEVYRSLQVTVVSSPIKVNVNPQILNNILHFSDVLQIQGLLKDLKQYRPHRRPITDVPDKYASRF